jgi:hypothetical protein
MLGGQCLKTKMFAMHILSCFCADSVDDCDYNREMGKTIKGFHHDVCVEPDEK